MFDLQSYTLFLATAVVLVLSPGPDTVLILSRTLTSGVPAGLMTLLGTQLGNVVHAVLAGVGVSTLILLVPVASTALKWVGAVYLLYLAWNTWRAPAMLPLVSNRENRPGESRRFFVQGMTNNLTNPKMIAFFLALFPQFVHPKSGSVAVQSLVLGVTLAIMAVAWIGFVVIVVGRFRAAVISSSTILKHANRLAALTFAGLACRLALEDAG